MKKRITVLGLAFILACGSGAMAEDTSKSTVKVIETLESEMPEEELIINTIPEVEDEIIIDSYMYEDQAETIFTEDLILLESLEQNTYGFSDFYPSIADMDKFSLISLTDMNIRCHVRGSIYCGGTLVGSQIVDDGTLNSTKEPKSKSLVYNNQSNIQFYGCSNSQSQYAYYKLTQKSIKDNINYWIDVFNTLKSLPENNKFIYVKPDPNGVVGLYLWDYHKDDSDDAYNHIEKIYYTDAEFVEIGGLAGNVIAPYANIRIVNCNYSGCIVGKSITNDGENYINNWKPELSLINSLAETPTITSKTTTKSTITTKSETAAQTIQSSSDTITYSNPVSTNDEAGEKRTVIYRFLIFFSIVIIGFNLGFKLGNCFKK